MQFKALTAILPSDSSLHLQLANLYGDHHGDDDHGDDANHSNVDTLILHQFSDSHSAYKPNPKVLSWLGLWDINPSLFQNAIQRFKTAATLYPRDPKWRLCIASAERRSGQFEEA